MSDFISTVNLPTIRRSGKVYFYLLTLLDRLIRRVMDIMVAFWGLIFLSPLFALIALAIRHDSPGPVFFRGTRMGYKGRIFEILKFRTMYERPESYQGTRVTASDDDRVTSFGRWLRDTKINELPQLWNVLVGDMSLVGPRPEDPALARNWPRSIRDEILSVRPGITSPASVIYRDEEQLLTGNDCEDEYLDHILPSKLRLDVLHVRNRSILADLDVIFLTGVALLPVFRKKAFPGRLLYNGPLKQFMTRFMNWFTIDFVIALLAVWLAGGVWRTFGPINVGWSESFLVSLGMGFFFSLVNLILGLNRISWAKAQAVSAIDLVLSAGIAVGLLLVIHQYFITFALFPHGIFILSGGFAATGFIGIRYRERLITGVMNRWLLARKQAKSVGERVLIVGAGEMGEFAVWFFTRSDFARAFHVVGFVDDDPRLLNIEIAGKTVIGSSHEIPALVRRHDIGLIIFAITRIDQGQRDQIVEICDGTSTRLVMFPDLMGIVRNCIEDAETPSMSVVPAKTERAFAGDAWLEELDQAIARGDIVEARSMVAQKKNKQLIGD